MNIEIFARDYLSEIVGMLFSPEKRVSLIYLGSAVFIAFAWYVYVTKGSALKASKAVSVALFSPSIIWSKSAKTDYKLFFINHCFIMIITPFMLTKIGAAAFFYYLFTKVFMDGTGILNGSSLIVMSITYTLFLFMLDDFSRYCVHAALHRIPFLWAFHKVHHTAQTLTPFTVFRTHPVEAVLFFIRGVFVQAFTVAVFVFLFGDEIDLLTIYGVQLFLFVFNISGANLRHSHCPIRYGGFLETFLISPAQHQIHHSTSDEHKDKNYGSVLAIWDLLFGTLYKSKKNMILKFGLQRNSTDDFHKLSNIYWGPCVEIFNGLKNKKLFTLIKWNYQHVAKTEK